MTKKFFLLLIMLIVYRYVLAQSGCATPPVDSIGTVLPYYGNNAYLEQVINDVETTIGSEFRWANDGYYYVPVKFWIHNRSDGSNGEDNLKPNNAPVYLQGVINSCNTLFSNTGCLIRLYSVCDIGYVDYTPYYDCSGGTTSNNVLTDVNYRIKGVLNVHIQDRVKVIINGVLGEYGGIAQMPHYKPNFVIAVNSGYSVVLVHEIGHALGLFHTFNSSDPTKPTNAECDICNQEPVSRAKPQPIGCSQIGKNKCEINGDYLCDTEADPYLTNSCNYIGSGTDYWHQIWQPNGHNFMSYAPSPCQNMFTRQQMGVMYYTLNSYTSTATANGLNTDPANNYITYQTTEVKNITSGGNFTQFVNPITPASVTNPSNIIKGDFAGDASTDLFVFSKPTGGNNLQISTSNGSFSGINSPINPASITFSPDNVIAADFAGDAKTDLFFHWKANGVNKLETSNGNGTFAQTSPITAAAISGNPDWVLVGDFKAGATNNPKSDLIFIWNSTGINYLQTSNGVGAFTQSANPIPPSAVFGNPDIILPADFNGDGKSDLFVYWISTGINRTLINNGSGSFTAYNNLIPTSISINGVPNLIAGDFTGEGNTDLYFVWQTNGNNKIYQSNAGTSFTDIPHPIDPLAIITYNYDGLTLPRTGDFDNDGKLDLYFHWGLSGKNRIHLGNGDGSFTHCFDPVVTCATNSSPTNIIVGDYNSTYGGSDIMFFWTGTGLNKLFNVIPGMMCSPNYRLATDPLITTTTNSLSEEISIYPNPTDGKIAVLFNYLDKKDVEIFIYNILGKEIYLSKQVQVQKAQYEVDLSNEAGGIYMVKIIADGEVIYKKFILSK